MAKCLQTISSLCLALTLSSSYEPTVCCQPTLPIACWEFARYTFCCKRIRSSENWSSISLELYGLKTDALAHCSKAPTRTRNWDKNLENSGEQIEFGFNTHLKVDGLVDQPFFVIWHHMSVFSAASKMVQNKNARSSQCGMFFNIFLRIIYKMINLLDYGCGLNVGQFWFSTIVYSFDTISSPGGWVVSVVALQSSQTAILRLPRLTSSGQVYTIFGNTFHDDALSYNLW